jgi:hypothetical protein
MIVFSLDKVYVDALKKQYDTWRSYWMEPNKLLNNVKWIEGEV